MRSKCHGDIFHNFFAFIDMQQSHAVQTPFSFLSNGTEVSICKLRNRVLSNEPVLNFWYYQDFLHPAFPFAVQTQNECSVLFVLFSRRTSSWDFSVFFENRAIWQNRFLPSNPIYFKMRIHTSSENVEQIRIGKIYICRILWCIWNVETTRWTQDKIFMNLLMKKKKLPMGLLLRNELATQPQLKQTTRLQFQYHPLCFYTLMLS